MNLTELEAVLARTLATRDEIRLRIAHALERHPLCRDVKFDVVSTPRNVKGGNWTVTMQSVGPGAIWEVSDIVADIQEAYDLALAA